MADTTTQKSATKRPRRMAREPKPQENVNAPSVPSVGAEAHAKGAGSAKGPSKNEAVLALLKRREGATLDQMVAATGWLPHTTRAVLTGFRKKGHSITSDKIDGVRTYRTAQSEGEQVTAEPGEHSKTEAATRA